MTVKDYLKYWLETAGDDWDTADKLIKLQKYHHALFFCHLALEKLLKGLVFKYTNTHAPPIHDLVKLATNTKLEFSSVRQVDLAEITTWNIKARYDSYKFEFYKKATKKYAKDWFQKAKEIYIWLRNQY